MEEKSLYEKLCAYGESDFYPYHMPGHKRRMGNLPDSLLKLDITEIDGFDNLHQPEGILHSLQEQANKLYGAEETFYLINGSTCGILSAVSAALPREGHILMARASHTSAYHAAYLRGLQVSYLYPEWMEDFDIAEAVTPSMVEQRLSEEEGVGAVFLVSPTYEGRIAEIDKIAEIVHRRGIPLIVDEAHGAHLGFADGFAKGSCTQGADLVIHSVHKTLPAMTQTALLHVNGSRIDRVKLKRFLHIYQSSSPSYVLMASIEDAMKTVERQGAEYFAAFRERYKKLLEQLQNCRVLRFVPWRDIEAGRQDIGKLVISAGAAKVSGKWIYDMLREEYRLQCEMAAGRFCLAMFTIADGPEAYQRMADALLAIDRKLESAERMGKEFVTEENGRQNREVMIDRPRIAFPLAKAWDMPYKMTRLSDAIDYPVGDFVNLYPPGVPLLVPGEILTEGLYEQILEYQNRFLNVQGIWRKNGENWIKVLTEECDQEI